MSSRTWKILGFTMSAAALQFGCAHQAKVAAAHTPSAPMASAVDPQAEADRLALEALLNGAVAHFDFDQDALTADDQTRLQKVASALHEHARAAIRISGHCDELGTEEYNLALGLRRAQVAKKYLVALGVESARIDTISYGEERPAVTGHDETAHAANRRDELEAQALK